MSVPVRKKGYKGRDAVFCVKVCFQLMGMSSGMSGASVKWEEVGKCRVCCRNGNWNCAILKWEAEARSYHRFMHGSISSLWLRPSFQLWSGA